MTPRPTSSARGRRAPARAAAVESPAVAPFKPIGLMVLGMHRSGTSATTRTLSLLGAALPKELLEANQYNPTGYWEPSRLRTLHDDLLRELDIRWDDWSAIDADWFRSPLARRYAREFAAFLADEFRNEPLFVLKDPRACRFVRLWRQAFDQAGMELKPVLALRNPMDVASSLAERDGMPETKAVFLWLRYMLEAEAGTRGLSRPS
ncbi:MAG: hypothetical protein WDM92_00375 [Caulobacteraceae bacterium]